MHNETTESVTFHMLGENAFHFQKGEVPMSLLKKIGLFGWKEEEENLVVASILTGDPLLLIGRHGSSKNT